MNRKYSDFMILSDVDGTLLTGNGKVPQRNIDAVERFTRNGGKFGIATGRSRELTQELLDQLPVNAPCVLYNGGAVYDYENDKYLMKLFLPEESKQFIKELLAFKPDLGVLVVSNSDYFSVTDEISFTNQKNYPAKAVDVDSLTDPWYKVLLLLRDNDYEQFIAYTAQRDFAGVRFVATNTHLVEMLPIDSSKGTALEYLIKEYGVDRENIAAIGDFYNDLEMIRHAGIGVTLCDAPEDIRAAADLVVGDCAGGAIADLIEYLEKTYPLQ